MNTAFDRALLLFQQKRYDLAQAEVGRRLAEDPHDPMAHALMAACLAARGEPEEARRFAEGAIRLAPDLASGHFTLAHILSQQEKYKEAEAAIREAIRLDPSDADYWSQLAVIQYNRRQWARALDSAEHGLALDPEHVEANNLRAMALVKLGRPGEAGATIEATLARDPENAWSHANRGWALLEQGRTDGALVHFREALRIDPMSEWARMGVIEALKSRYPVYRQMLRYFLWTSKLSRQAQWALLIGIVFGQNILGAVGRSYPALAPFVYPTMLVVFAFLVMTWIADPLFNLLLRFNRFGRLVLNEEQVLASNCLASCLAGAAASLIAYFLTSGRDSRLLLLAIDLALLAIPVAVIFRCPAGRPRQIMVAATVLLILAGPGAIGMTYVPTIPVPRRIELFKQYYPLFFPGVILSTWAPALLGQVVPRRRLR